MPGKRNSAQLPFRTLLPVRATDIDASGLINTVALAELLEEARQQFIRQRLLITLSASEVAPRLKNECLNFSSRTMSGSRVLVEIEQREKGAGTLSLAWRVSEEKSGEVLARGTSMVEFPRAEAVLAAAISFISE